MREHFTLVKSIGKVKQPAALAGSDTPGFDNIGQIFKPDQNPAQQVKRGHFNDQVEADLTLVGGHGQVHQAYRFARND